MFNKVTHTKTGIEIRCYGYLVILMILLPALAGSGGAVDLTLPTLEPVRTKTAPKIDGLLDDACWQEAQAIRDFWLQDGSEKIVDVIWAKVVYDSSHLYVSYHIPADKTTSLPRGSKTRDEGVWFSPNIQVFIQPTSTSGYYIFTLNSENTQEDAKNFVTTWDCKWDSAVFIAPEQSYWQVELAIPFAVFDLSDNPGENWRFNITCAHISKDNKGYILTWGPTYGSFHTPDLFGNLILKNDWNKRQCQLDVRTFPGKAGAFNVELISSTGSNLGKGNVAVSMTTPSGKVKVKQQPVLLTEKSQLTNISFPTDEQGAHEFHLRLQKKDGVVLAERQNVSHTPAIFDVWLDKSLYTGEAQAQLTIKSWQSSAAGKKCKVVITNPEGEVQGNPVITKLDKQLTATVDIDLQNIGVGDYTVAVLPIETGKNKKAEAYAKCGLIKLAPQPGTVPNTSRGVIEVDRKPVFPFGMYYIQKYLDENNLLEEYTEAGFNTIVWEWTNAEGYVKALEKVQPYGIYLITSVQNEGKARSIQDAYWRAEGEQKEQLAEDYYKHIDGVVKHVASSNPSNLLGWYIQDEPNLEMFDFVSKSTSVVKAADPRRPTLVVPCHSRVFRDYASVVDLLAPDAYPGFPGGPITKVSDFIQAARDVVNDRKPVVIVLQAFGERGGPEEVLPTPAELRCMTYLSLVHEARGVIYFSYNYNGPMREANPAQWQELKKLAGEVRDIAPALSQTAGVLSVEQSEGTSQVHTRVIQHGKTAYMIAVNTQRKAVKNVKWQSSGFIKNGQLEVMRENRDLQINGGMFSDDFEPLGVHVYRQKSE